MSNIADKLNYLNDTKKAIKTSIKNRGVDVSDDDTFRSYADKIDNIGETVDKIKFGASVDAVIGDVDENGVLQPPTWTGALNFAGVKEIGERSLYQTFTDYFGVTSVDLSSVISVAGSGLYETFRNDSGGYIKEVSLRSLITVGEYGMYYAFWGNKELSILDLSFLTTIDERGLWGTFGLTGVEEIAFNSLTTVGSLGLAYVFYRCEKLKKVLFPSLINISTNGLNQSSFGLCPNLTEIHFRVDMQSTIEAMSSYVDKWGATNATIYFDL